MTENKNRLLVALAQAKVDFRLTSTLAKDLNLTEAVVEETLKNMPDLVRNPVGARDEELHWWRLVNRRLTKREHLRIALSIMARRPL